MLEIDTSKNSARVRTARARVGVQRVVVFDLDDTLLRGDSFGLFLRALMLRRPARAAASLLSAVVLLPLFLLTVTHDRAVSAFLWLLGHADDAFTVVLAPLEQHLEVESPISLSLAWS